MLSFQQKEFLVNKLIRFLPQEKTFTPRQKYLTIGLYILRALFTLTILIQIASRVFISLPTSKETSETWFLVLIFVRVIVASAYIYRPTRLL